MNIKPLKITPSSLPYIAQCPCWERLPSPPGPAALRGTALDTKLRLWLQSPSSSKEIAKDARLNDKDVEGLEWAKDTILSKCGSHPVLTEKSQCRFKFTIEGVLISGEMDGYCPGGVSVFDLKSGKIRDYKHQVIPYALRAMQDTGAKEASTHLVFCDQRVVTSRVFTYDEAYSTLAIMALSWSDPNKQPKKCHACEYCKHADAGGRCRYGVRGLGPCR